MRKTRSAFTVIELIVVLMIVLIIGFILFNVGGNNGLIVPVQINSTRYDFSVGGRDTFADSLAQFERDHPELKIVQTTPSDFNGYQGRPMRYIVTVEPRPTNLNQQVEAR